MKSFDNGPVEEGGGVATLVMQISLLSFFRTGSIGQSGAAGGSP